MRPEPRSVKREATSSGARLPLGPRFGTDEVETCFFHLACLGAHPTGVTKRGELGPSRQGGGRFVS